MKTPDTLAEILTRASAVMFPNRRPRVIAIDARDADGDTPLHKAVAWGDRHAVRTLLEAGASVDLRGDLACTALYLAVLKMDLAMAEIPVDYGADPDLPSELGGTPRSVAAARGHVRLVRLFKKGPEKSSATDVQAPG